jgi:hypothetical protein
MSYPACSSCTQVEFPVEMLVHRGGLKNLDNSGVMLFPKILVCGLRLFAVYCAEIRIGVACRYSAKWTTDDGDSELTVALRQERWNCSLLFRY